MSINDPRLPRKFRSKLRRFLDFSAPIEVESSCWLWTAAKTDGYGRAAWNGKLLQAHRLAWQLIHGSLPPKPLQLDHLCRNRACCNPEHLEPVTTTENVHRGCRARGILLVRLNRAERRQIHDLLESGLFLKKEIAAMYGVGQGRLY